MDYSKKSVVELKALCKERNIKGISGKIKKELIDMLQTPTITSIPQEAIILRQDIIHGDTLNILPT